MGSGLEAVHSRHQHIEQDDGEFIPEQSLERCVP